MKRRVLLSALAIPSLSWATPLRILVVESYHHDFIWDQEYRQELIALLGERFSLEFFEMDTKRIPVAQHPSVAQKALARIRALQPALVILGDDTALQLLGTPLDAMSIPGVYLGINGNPRKYGQSDYKNITGVLERPLIKRNIAFLRQIIPSLKKVLVLFDNDLTSRVTMEEVFYGKSTMRIDGMQIDMKLSKTQEDWRQNILTAKSQGYDATVAGLYHTLTLPNGRVANADEVIAWTSTHTPIPLFALWGFAVGPDKAIGGLVLSGREQGKMAAGIALDILEGRIKVSSRAPVTARQGDFVFSKTQLERYHITLPTDIATAAKMVD